MLGTDIAVNISVEAENPRVRETLSKSLSANLRALNRDIVVLEGSATYLVNVRVMEIKSGSDAAPGYVFSTIVTVKEYATRRNKPAELVDRLLDSSMILSDPDQLEETIKNIAAFAASNISAAENRRYMRFSLSQV